MNKEIAKELQNYAHEVCNRYSRTDREGNYNKESFKIREIIPTSDHTKFLACVMALEKLKVIDSENDGQTGYYIGIKKSKIHHFKDNKIEISKDMLYL